MKLSTETLKEEPEKERGGSTLVLVACQPSTLLLWVHAPITHFFDQQSSGCTITPPPYTDTHFPFSFAFRCGLWPVCQTETCRATATKTTTTEPIGNTL